MKKLIVLSLLAPALALADGAPGRMLVAPEVGLFLPSPRLSSAFYGGVQLGYVTPLLSDRLAFQLDVDWTRPRGTGSVADPRVPGGSASYDLGDADVGVQLSAVYRFEGKLTPYLGVGPGLYFHRAAMHAYSSTYIETEGKLGFQALAGVDYALGPGAAFLEVRYAYTAVDFLSTGDANMGGFLAPGVGYRLRF